MNENVTCAYVCKLVGPWLERRILTRPGDTITSPEIAVPKLLAGESVIVAGGEVTKLSLLVDGERTKLLPAQQCCFDKHTEGSLCH